MGQHPLYGIISLIVACIVLNTATADEKEDICGDIKGTTVDSSDIPNFRGDLEVHAEISYSSGIGIIEYNDIYFASYPQVMRVDLKHYKYESQQFFLFKADEILTFNYREGERDTCRVTIGMKKSLNFFILHPYEVKRDLKTTDILRLTGPSGFDGDDVELKQSDDVVARGQKAKKYLSCQKLLGYDGEDYIVKVTHIVLEKPGEDPIMLQITAEGKYQNGDKLHIIYNFFHHKNYFTKISNFELPEGFVCEDRQDKGFKFPEFPTHIKFSQEVHYPDPTKKIKFIDTVYNKEANFVLETYLDSEGKWEHQRLDDFSTGLSFKDNYKGDYTCEVTKISEDSRRKGDYVMEDDGTIHVVTPKDFFHAGGMDFHYNGEKLFLLYNTDVWAGYDKKTNDVVAWYFHKNGTKKLLSPSDDKLPYKRVMWSKGNSKPTTTYFYQMEFGPTEETLAVGSSFSFCFDRAGRYIYIYLPALQQDQLEKEGTKMALRLMNKLAEPLKVSMVRFQHPYLEFFGDLGVLSFFINGPPKIEGYDEASADTIAASLKDKLQNLKLNVGSQEVPIMSEGVIIEDPHKHGFGTTASKTQGYSTGALAGLAVGMTILGLAAGGAGGFWFFVKNS